MTFSFYKKGQGMASRIGVAALILVLGLYAGYCWYWWLYNPETASLAANLLSASFLGSVALAVIGAGLGVYLAFLGEKSGDYLIDMDLELRKVVWPPVQPLFDYKAEAWGSTYVVIISTVILTVFIWLVDTGLNLILTQGLLRLLFSHGV